VILPEELNVVIDLDEGVQDAFDGKLVLYFRKGYKE
jgi:hypothetical protein